MYYLPIVGRKYHFCCRRPIAKVVLSASPGKKIVYAPREQIKNASVRMFSCGSPSTSATVRCQLSPRYFAQLRFFGAHSLSALCLRWDSFRQALAPGNLPCTPVNSDSVAMGARSVRSLAQCGRPSAQGQEGYLAKKLFYIKIITVKNDIKLFRKIYFGSAENLNQGYPFSTGRWGGTFSNRAPR